MKNTLTVLKNHAKIDALNVNRMEESLSNSNNDVRQFFFRLAVIANKHHDKSIQNKAWKFLNKQDKLQEILTDLINRLQSLKINTSISRSEQIQTLTQLNTEIDIFHEIHFEVKRAYIGFTSKYFQEGLKQSFMVA